jgi:hypothetical protein
VTTTTFSTEDDSPLAGRVLQRTSFDIEAAPTGAPRDVWDVVEGIVGYRLRFSEDVWVVVSDDDAEDLDDIHAFNTAMWSEFESLPEADDPEA